MNGFRRNDLIRLAATGWVYSVEQLDSMRLLDDDEEREWVRDLLTARHAGFNLHALQSQADRIIAVVSQRAPRLAQWLRVNRSPAEVVAFVLPEDNDTGIVEKFTEAGGEGRSRNPGRSGEKPNFGKRPRAADGSLIHGSSREYLLWSNARYRANGQRPTILDRMTKLRAAKLQEAEAALKVADDNHSRAAQALGISRKALMRRLNYRHLDGSEFIPSPTEPAKKPTKKEPARRPATTRQPLPTVSEADRKRLLDAIAHFKQQ